MKHLVTGSLLCAAIAATLAAQTLTTLANFDHPIGGEPDSALVQAREPTGSLRNDLGGRVP